jgi:hypothetical protein
MTASACSEVICYGLFALKKALGQPALLRHLALGQPALLRQVRVM